MALKLYSHQHHFLNITLLLLFFWCFGFYLSILSSSSLTTLGDAMQNVIVPEYNDNKDHSDSDICRFPDSRSFVSLCVFPQFSDNYYRAELIEALTNSLTPAISISNEVRTVDNLHGDVRLILEEITRFLNMEKLLPSFRNTITVRYTAAGGEAGAACSILLNTLCVWVCAHDEGIILTA